MDKDFAPLIDVSEVDMKNIIEASPDTKLAKSIKRVLEVVNDDNNDILSAFQSFVS